MIHKSDLGTVVDQAWMDKNEFKWVKSFGKANCVYDGRIGSKELTGIFEMLPRLPGETQQYLKIDMYPRQTINIAEEEPYTKEVTYTEGETE